MGTWKARQVQATGVSENVSVFHYFVWVSEELDNISRTDLLIPYALKIAKWLTQKDLLF